MSRTLMTALAIMLATVIGSMAVTTSAMAATRTPFWLRWGATHAHGTLTWNRNGTVTVRGALKAATTVYRLDVEGFQNGRRIVFSNLPDTDGVLPGRSATTSETLSRVDAKGIARSARIDTVAISLVEQASEVRRGPYQFCRRGAAACESRTK